nr:histidine kinase N-terminal 7TM domain-containing protein [Halogeometricum sp. CBA1124]
MAWRQRPEPGATPLVALLVGQSWWSVCILFGLREGTVAARLFWTNWAWVGVVAIPVAWLLFALEYTGRDEYVQPRYVAALSFVPALTVLLMVTDRYHDLLYLRPYASGSTASCRWLTAAPGTRSSPATPTSSAGRGWCSSSDCSPATPRRSEVRGRRSSSGC